MKETGKDKNVIVKKDTDKTIVPDAVLNKPNLLITCKYTVPLSAFDLKINNYGLWKAEFNKEQNRHIAVFTPSEIREFFGIDSNSFYAKLNPSAKRLRKGAIIYEDKENDEFLQMNLIGVAHYKKGVFTIKYESDASSIISNLKPNYTKLQMKVYKHLNNKHAIILYELLKSKYFNCSVLQVDYEIKELKYYLDMIRLTEDAETLMVEKKLPLKDVEDEHIAKETHKETNVFTKAIKTALKEINEHTDINVEFDTLRKGNTGKGGKISHIKFIVTEHEYVEQLEEEVEEVVELTEEGKFNMVLELSRVMKEHLSLDEYRSILEKANYDMDNIKKKYDIMKRSNDVKNVVGWMLDAIENDYSEPIEQVEIKKEPSVPDTNNNFNKFEQRNYTKEELKELEKKLLQK